MLPGYYRNIPSHVCDDENLKDSEKLFYGLIASLTPKFGFCFASNAYLAQQSKCTIRQIQRMLGSLKELGYLIIEIEHENERRIWLPEYYSQKEKLLTKYKEELNQRFYTHDQTFIPPMTKQTGGHDQMVIHNIITNIKDLEKKATYVAKENAAAADFPKRVKKDPPKVELTKEERQKLDVTYGKEAVEEKIESINDHMLSTGVRYKDYPATIRNWFRRDKKQNVRYKPVEIDRRPRNADGTIREMEHRI